MVSISNRNKSVASRLTIAAPEGNFQHCLSEIVRCRPADADWLISLVNQCQASAGARVIVNRVCCITLVKRLWRRHLSWKAGVEPTLPKLLDWLADEFIAAVGPKSTAPIDSEIDCLATDFSPRSEDGGHRS